MNNETGQRLTEAIWALTSELALQRQPAPTTEPPHTGAAPVTSGEFQVGDWVRVTGPDDDRLIGKVGRVRTLFSNTAQVDFSGMYGPTFNLAYLEPAPKPTTHTPRH